MVEEEVQRRIASREKQVSDVKAEPTGNRGRRVDWLAGLVAACSILTLSARHWWVADLIANLRVQLIRSVSTWNDPFGTVQADVALLGRSVQIAGASPEIAVAGVPREGSCASTALEINSSDAAKLTGRQLVIYLD